MKTKIFVAIFGILIFTAMSCISQTTQKYNPKKISKYSDQELIWFLSYTNCVIHDQDYPPDGFPFWDVQNELLKRKHISNLLHEYETTQDQFLKEKLLGVLFNFTNAQISNAMLKTANTNTDIIGYLSNAYLARQGYIPALENLNRNFMNYPVSSWEFSYVVGYFGRYKYYPAVQNLIQSISAASGNLSGACLKSLFLLYPEANQDFNSTEEAEQYFRDYIKRK
jgi:hypothetical protein